MNPTSLFIKKIIFMRVRQYISMVVLVAFVGTSIKTPAFAQSVDPMPRMPAPGVMVHLSPEFTPAYLKGIVIDPHNALKFDFIIFKGDKSLSDDQKKIEYTKLTKYFLASLAIPDDDQWVNLSPYEKDRIIKDDFGKTEMGRDLLAQDYLLKQITASLIYPESNLGKKFWDRIYSEAQKKYGTSSIPVNTFNKVWILPGEALIYEKGNTAYVLKNHLRVMLEEDYLSLQKHSGIQSRPMDNNTHSIASKIVKEIVLPALEQEINEGKNFAALRQVYSGMLLAAWYKRALRESLLSRIYANKAKLKGVDQDPKANEEIYRQYLKAYKKGVFNFIRDDVDKYSNQTIPRKYFSGGEVGYGATQGVGKVYDEEVRVEKAMNVEDAAAVQEALSGNAYEDVKVVARESAEVTAEGHSVLSGVSVQAVNYLRAHARFAGDRISFQLPTSLGLGRSGPLMAMLRQVGVDQAQLSADGKFLTIKMAKEKIAKIKEFLTHVKSEDIEGEISRIIIPVAGASMLTNVAGMALGFVLAIVGLVLYGLSEGAFDKRVNVIVNILNKNPKILVTASESESKTESIALARERAGKLIRDTIAFRYSKYNADEQQEMAAEIDIHLGLDKQGNITTGTFKPFDNAMAAPLAANLNDGEPMQVQVSRVAGQMTDYLRKNVTFEGDQIHFVLPSVLGIGQRNSVLESLRLAGVDRAQISGDGQALTLKMPHGKTSQLKEYLKNLRPEDILFHLGFVMAAVGGTTLNVNSLGPLVGIPTALVGVILMLRSYYLDAAMATTYSPRLMYMLSVLFSSQDAINAYLKYNYNLYTGLGLEWQRENLAAFKEKMKNGPKVLDILETVRDHNRKVMSAFKQANAGTDISGQLAEVTHMSFLEGERLKPSFVEYTQPLHDFLLELINHGVITQDGKDLTLDEFLNSEKKFKIKPADFNWEKIISLSLRSDMQRRLSLFVNGKSSFVINTVAGDWHVLNSIKGFDIPVYQGRPGKTRQAYLSGLQDDSVSAVLAALSNKKILNRLQEQGLGAATIVEILRYINVGWRINNPWYGIEAPLLGKPYTIGSDGIGIDEIQKDGVVLKAILEKLYAAIQTGNIHINPAIKKALTEAFHHGLAEDLKVVLSKEQLAQAIENNSVKEAFSFDAGKTEMDRQMQGVIWDTYSSHNSSIRLKMNDTLTDELINLNHADPEEVVRVIAEAAPEGVNFFPVVKAVEVSSIDRIPPLAPHADIVLTPRKYFMDNYAPDGVFAHLVKIDGGVEVLFYKRSDAAMRDLDLPEVDYEAIALAEEVSKVDRIRQRYGEAGVQDYYENNRRRAEAVSNPYSHVPAWGLYDPRFDLAMSHVSSAAEELKYLQSVASEFLGVKPGQEKAYTIERSPSVVPESWNLVWKVKWAQAGKNLNTKLRDEVDQYLLNVKQIKSSKVRNRMVDGLLSLLSITPDRGRSFNEVNGNDAFHFNVYLQELIPGLNNDPLLDQKAMEFIKIQKERANGLYTDPQYKLNLNPLRANTDEERWRDQLENKTIAKGKRDIRKEFVPALKKFLRTNSDAVVDQVLSRIKIVFDHKHRGMAGDPDTLYMYGLEFKQPGDVSVKDVEVAADHLDRIHRGIVPNQYLLMMPNLAGEKGRATDGKGQGILMLKIWNGEQGNIEIRNINNQFLEELRSPQGRIDSTFVTNDFDNNGTKELDVLGVQRISIRGDDLILQRKEDAVVISSNGIHVNKAMKHAVSSIAEAAFRKGGIDFNAAHLNLQIKRDGDGVPLPISQLDLDNIRIDGLVPEIIEIRPASASPLMSELQLSGVRQAKV
jgi:hypothetical protein